jgi:murein DD-endopeptidase MepM/ murein hydrolase activator NlpD
MSFSRNMVLCALIAALLTACVQVAAQPARFPTYDPFLPIPSNTPEPSDVSSYPTVTLTGTLLPLTATRPPTPTRAPLAFSPPPSSEPFFPILTVEPGATAALIVDTPTPDAQRILPTPRQAAEQYVVQAGDTLGHIAQVYGISVETLMQTNNITDPNMLYVGMSLNVPAPDPGSAGPAFKVIPDSEVVYSPANVYFDTKKFIDSQNGYLETYEQDVNGIMLTGYEIVGIVARNYSVNPRLLLALLEYQSGWVTNPAPFNTSYPMGFLNENNYGLYRQLTWAANNINQGYYLWKANAVSTYVLNDGSVVPVDPTINAGTAAVQYFFAQFDDRATWEKDVSGTGLLLTYYVFFGNPFKYSIEPLAATANAQPAMRLPFGPNESWYFTGGPHGGWDSGSAWAALDFAPPGDNGNCGASPLWVTAVADGLILRASNGAVLQDLDNDGYEQTGWVILYMHVAADGRVREGEYLFAGERVGHPSCEGGISNATHVHIARKYNGEWIAADGPIPFNLDGWVSSGTGREYDGYLTRGNVKIEAFDSANDFNLVYH